MFWAAAAQQAGGGGKSAQSGSTSGGGTTTAGAVTVQGLTMGSQKDELAGALKWGLVALAVVAASRYWAPKRS